jgi:hypothetical protein
LDLRTGDGIPWTLELLYEIKLVADARCRLKPRLGQLLKWRVLFSLRPTELEDRQAAQLFAPFKPEAAVTVVQAYGMYGVAGAVSAAVLETQ